MEVPKEMALSQALGKSWLGEEGAEPHQAKVTELLNTVYYNDREFEHE